MISLAISQWNSAVHRISRRTFRNTDGLSTVSGNEMPNWVAVSAAVLICVKSPIDDDKLSIASLLGVSFVLKVKSLHREERVGMVPAKAEDHAFLVAQLLQLRVSELTSITISLVRCSKPC